MYIVKDIATRNSIPAAQRVDGDAVFVSGIGQTFFLRGGITNNHWSGPDEWATTANMDLYVDPAGDDAVGTGLIGAPYATIKRAYKDVPFLLKHSVRMFIATGTYADDFPAVIRHEAVGNGQLIFEGVDGLSDDLGTLTSTTTTVTASGYGGTYPMLATVNVAGAGWGANAHVGKIVKATSGANTGKFSIVRSNTADTLTLYAGGTSIPDTGEDFTLGLPLAEITSISRCSIEIKDHDSGANIYGPSYSRLGLGLLDLSFSCSDGAMFITGTATRISACTLDSTANPLISFIKSAANQKDFVDTANAFTGILAHSYYDDVCVMVRRNLYNGGSFISGFKSQASSKLVKELSNNSFGICSSCAFAQYGTNQKASLDITLCVFGHDTTYDCIELGEMCRCTIYASYFAAGKNIINARSGSKIRIGGCSQAAAAGFTEYGSRLQGDSSIAFMDEASRTVGNLGDIYFEQTATAVANPTQGNMQADGQACFVITNKA